MIPSNFLPNSAVVASMTASLLKAQTGSQRPFYRGPSFASSHFLGSDPFSSFTPNQNSDNQPNPKDIKQSKHHRSILQNPCPDPICKVHPDKRTALLPGLAAVTGYIGAGFLLHQLPPRLPKDGMKTLLPADWKVWARVILGIAAVQKLNQTINWKPPPWLGALEAVAIVNPIAVGVTKHNLIQMGVMAPVIASVVQLANTLQKKISKPLQDRYDTPPVLVRLGLSLALGIGSLIAYPFIYKRIATSGVLGKELKDQAMESGSAFASAAFATCARGCSPGSFICLGEVADVVGSLGTWNKNSKPNPSDNETSPNNSPPNIAKGTLSKQIVSQQKTQS
jgi:hypothetical protein